MPYVIHTKPPAISVPCGARPSLQAALQKQMEKEAQEDAQRKVLQDQEERDRELALRLAKEDTSQVEDLTQLAAKWVT